MPRTFLIGWEGEGEEEEEGKGRRKGKRKGEEGNVSNYSVTIKVKRQATQIFHF